MLVGRSNVGKSTLLNALTRAQWRARARRRARPGSPTSTRWPSKGARAAPGLELLLRGPAGLRLREGRPRIGRRADPDRGCVFRRRPRDRGRPPSRRLPASGARRGSRRGEMAAVARRRARDPGDENRQAVTQRAREEPKGTRTATRHGRPAHLGNQRRRTGRSVDTDSKTEQAVAARPRRAAPADPQEHQGAGPPGDQGRPRHDEGDVASAS